MKTTRTRKQNDPQSRKGRKLQKSSSSIWTKPRKLSSGVPQSSTSTSLLVFRTLNSCISYLESFFTLT